MKPGKGRKTDTMIIECIGRTLARELAGLRRQLLAYQAEEDIWRLDGTIANSAGTLALHVAGNLQHFIGRELGGTGYERDRDAEFARRGVPRNTLLAEIDAAEEAVRAGLLALTDADLPRRYPLDLAGRRLTIGEFLVHLSAHLAYHVGQVDYHRRLLGSPDAAALDMVALKALGLPVTCG